MAERSPVDRRYGGDDEASRHFPLLNQVGGVTERLNGSFLLMFAHPVQGDGVAEAEEDGAAGELNGEVVVVSGGYKHVNLGDDHDCT